MKEEFEWPGSEMVDKCIIEKEPLFCVICLKERDLLEDFKCEECTENES